MSAILVALLLSTVTAALVWSVFRAKDLGVSSWMRAREDDEQMWAIQAGAGRSKPDPVPTLY